jgi:hypothetical protein
MAVAVALYFAAAAYAATATAEAEPEVTRRHTTLWMNHKISANIEFAVKHADALTRIVPSYACWHIADNGSHAAPECGPKTLGRLQKMGIELWPEVSVSKASMVSGSWKPALSASGTLGPIMKAWGWRGVMIDEEEPNDTPQCRREHCGDPEAHCSACLPKVSAPQYGAFLTEFAAALKVHGLGLQITAGMSGPVPIIEDRQGWIENYTAAMASIGGKLAVLYPFAYGGSADKQQKELIARYKANHSLERLNLVFGGEFRELIQNGTSGMVNTSNLTECPVRGSRPPCPYINYHWQAADYNTTLAWLAAEGACEITIYPGPGGNLPAGAPLPRGRPGVTAEPGRLWTKYIAPWMIDGLRRFKQTPLQPGIECGV